MIPGVTKRPVPSITCAPAGTATLAPTAAILPSRITIVPFSIVPLAAVMMVALVMATSRAAGGIGIVSGAWAASVTGKAASVLARKGGSVAMLTVHKRVEVDLEPAIRGELHLVGAICYSYREYQRALGLLAEGGVDVEPLARHVFPLDQAQEAFDFVLSRQGVKAILSVAGGAGPADAARR